MTPRISCRRRWILFSLSLCLSLSDEMMLLFLGSEKTNGESEQALHDDDDGAVGRN